MKSGKIVSVLLSSAILWCGCYSYAPVAKDETLAGDKDARFRLKDGGWIEASAGQYSRIEGGYQVSGTLVRQDPWQQLNLSGVRQTNTPFDGVVQDGDIKEVTVNRYNSGSTWVLVGLSATLVVVAVASADWSFHP